MAPLSVLDSNPSTKYRTTRRRRTKTTSAGRMLDGSNGNVRYNKEEQQAVRSRQPEQHGPCAVRAHQSQRLDELSQVTVKDNMETTEQEQAVLLRRQLRWWKRPCRNTLDGHQGMRVVARVLAERNNSYWQVGWGGWLEHGNGYHPQPARLLQTPAWRRPWNSRETRTSLAPRD